MSKSGNNGNCGDGYAGSREPSFRYPWRSLRLKGRGEPVGGHTRAHGRSAPPRDETEEIVIKVSVIVPTCGRPALLNRCLEALVNQSFDPMQYEIIVVDDAPSEDVQALVVGWTVRSMGRGPIIGYIASKGPHGPAAARNLGWQAACGDIVAFTDDDTVPDPDWLRNGLRAFDAGVDAAWGKLLMPLPEEPTDYEIDARHLEEAEFATANCFCRKQVLEEVEGFDTRFRLAWREDSDLYFRLLQRTGRVIHVPEAIVVHPVREAPWGISLLQQKKVVYDALLYKKHPRLYREKIRAKPRWDYYLIVASLLIAIGAAMAGNTATAALAATVWLGLTGLFSVRRLQCSSKSAAHIIEMIVTSALIPPVSVFWRLVGAVRYRSLLV